tara:strand:+ start:3826 stop:4020 length:195 start_codon:yes stop_codon:yes gene_type:complete
MDSEKKPIEKVAEEIKELVNSVSSLRNDISYIKVNLIQHIKSIDKKEDINKEEIKDIKKGWYFW